MKPIDLQASHSLLEVSTSLLFGDFLCGINRLVRLSATFSAPIGFREIANSEDEGHSNSQIEEYVFLSLIARHSLDEIAVVDV